MVGWAYGHNFDLISASIYNRIDRRPCISFGRTASSFRTEVHVDGEELLSMWSHPCCNKWFAGGVPSIIGGIDAPRIEATGKKSS